ncbi:MAG TPA: hypothetical protein ENJ00_03560 [Phycisphaerales bacterium]|nr:hypothetical protein [Phycisphaerales bacterium]
MAIFGKKKGSDDVTEQESDEQTYSPAKAKVWFDQAKTVQETGSYDYAMNCWLSGLAYDPHSVDALESFMNAAVALAGESKKGPSKETKNAASGKGGVFKYTSALLGWGTKPGDASAAVKAAVTAAQQGYAEPAYWIGERALKLTLADPKLKKDSCVKLMKAMREIGAHDLAVKAGEAAMRLDPTDSQLESEVRNMAAQATMSRGGFEDTGQVGGFRKNIRDADKQRLLDEADRITKTDDSHDRLVKAAREDYESRPDDVPANKTYIKRLLDRAKPGDEKLAYKLAMKAFENTGQVSFRQQAWEIELRVMRRRVAAIRTKAEAGDAEAKELLPKAERKYLAKQMEFQKWRVEAFPTDNAPRYELGKLLFQMGDYKQAIPYFQKSQHDSRYKSSSLAMLGESFGKIGLTDPAINTLKQAIGTHPDTHDALGMQLRYSLMDALETKARNERVLQAALEAEELASAIAMEQFDYRDIQERYEAIKKLVAELRDS